MRNFVFQPQNGRYSEVVRFRDGAGKDVLAVMDFGDNKDAVYMNGYEGGTYNVLVTAFNPDNLQGYLENNEVIYDKKKDAPQRGSGSILPSHLNGSPFADIITRDDREINRNSALGTTTEQIDALNKRIKALELQYQQALEEAELEEAFLRGFNMEE